MSERKHCWMCLDDGDLRSHTETFTDSRTGRHLCHPHVDALLSWEFSALTEEERAGLDGEPFRRALDPTAELPE